MTDPAALKVCLQEGHRWERTGDSLWRCDRCEMRVQVPNTTPPLEKSKVLGG